MKAKLSIAVDLSVNVLAPLIIGGLIYYSSRPHSVYFVSWIDTLLGVQPRAVLYLPSWAIYHLPDGLWAYAFSSLLFIIWQRNICKQNLTWIISPLVIAIIIEIMYGIFDPIDLIYSIVGALLPFFIQPYHKHFLSTNTQLHDQNF